MWAALTCVVDKKGGIWCGGDNVFNAVADSAVRKMCGPCKEFATRKTSQSQGLRWVFITDFS